MRHLVVSVCLCLITWSGATGADQTLPLGKFTGIGTSKVLGEPSENIDAGLAPGDPDEAVALPLAPLHPLLKPIIHRSRQEICDTLAEAARSNDLPADFFIRLLYQESSFRPDAVSSAGAQGIAQFMPETAADRGLDNPFDPLQAIPASARLLRDLLQKFGTWPRRRCLQCGPQARRGLARHQGQAAAGDARLRQDDHRLAGGDVDPRQSRQPGGETSAIRALPRGRRRASLERAGPDPFATAEPTHEGFIEPCKGRAAAPRPFWQRQ